MAVAHICPRWELLPLSTSDDDGPCMIATAAAAARLCTMFICGEGVSCPTTMAECPLFIIKLIITIVDNNDTTISQHVLTVWLLQSERQKIYSAIVRSSSFPSWASLQNFTSTYGAVASSSQTRGNKLTHDNNNIRKG